MRNRREELCDIPVEYVTSIDYDINTYATMTLEIPSMISYKGTQFNFFLYDEIKGKMLIICDINGEKSKFIIDEDIEITEEKDISVKKLTAYSYEKTLDKKTFIIPEGATRQLYRSPNETVEISDGILNWLEEQTQWSINYVDVDAMKDTGLYMVNENIVLYNQLENANVDKDEVLWSKADININVGDKPLNMTISYPEISSYRNGVLQKSEVINHTFTNLPYGIKHIWMKYTSDSDYRYGATYTFEYMNGTRETFKKPFTNVLDSHMIAKNVTLSYETGEYEEQQVTKYRYFEQCSTTWYGFLMSDVAKAYDCVILFDSYKQQINVYSKKNFGEFKGLHMSYENGIKTINKKQKIGEVVSRLYVESPNCSISSENPLGGEFVECYDYYINSSIMSSELTQALKRYNTLLEAKQVEWLQVKLDKNTCDQKRTKKESELKTLQEKLKAENAILTGFIKAEDKEKQKHQSGIVSDIEAQIQSVMNEIQQLKDEIQTYSDRITAIADSIVKENAKDSAGQIFTELDLEELTDYTVEGSMTNDYYTLAYSLYQHAVEYIKDLNSIQIEFEIDTYDFLRKIIHPLGWQYLVAIGDKVEVDDKDVMDRDGYIQLYGYTYYPNENRIATLKFTNNKEPKSAIKTIGDIGRQTSQQISMTNFYKDVWKDSANNNIVVSDLIQNGLDLSAQIARGRGEINKIDISESGIYIIDSQNEDKQLYLGSGIISMTNDRWKTSEIAIDSNGVIAQTVTGKLLLGEKLQIGDEDDTFTIEAHGLTISDKNSSQSERIFLGLETQKDGTKKAVFRLHSSNNSSKLMLSEDGIYQVFSFQARDNYDYQNSLVLNFYLPRSLQRLDEAKLIFNLDHFRGYTKGAKQKEQVSSSGTSSDGGGSSTTSQNGGGSTVNKTTGMKYFTGKTTTPPYGSSNGDQANIHMGSHYHHFTVPEHSHTISFSVPAHKHEFYVGSHSHKVDVTIPAHNHELIHGIFKYGNKANTTILIDGQTVAEGVGGDRELDVLKYIKKDGSGNYGGTHSIEIRANSTSANPEGLGRASISLFIGGFISW